MPLTHEELNKRSFTLLAHASNVVDDYEEDYSNQNEKHLGMLTGMLVAVAFSRTVRHAGWLNALRYLFGAIFVAIKYRKLEL